MVSIKDLGKPVQPPELSRNAADGAAKAALLRMEAIKRTGIIWGLSYSASPKLSLPKTPVHEVMVETPHIVRVMQAQAAKAQKLTQESSRPQWQRWVFWSSLIGGAGVLITFVLTVLTYWQTFGL